MKCCHITFDIDGTMLDSTYADLAALQKVLFALQNTNYLINDLHFAWDTPGEVGLKRLGVKDTSALIKYGIAI